MTGVVIDLEQQLVEQSGFAVDVSDGINTSPRRDAGQICWMTFARKHTVLRSIVASK
jgi:hypothetical protein